MGTVSDTCIRCDWGTALGTAYCAPCLEILVALENGEQPTIDDPLDVPPERAILLDLIERLRAGDPTFGDEPPLWVKTALYNAEHRLREVSSE